MRRFLIHPRRGMIIRKGLFGEKYDLDALDSNLSFIKTFVKSEEGESVDEFFERVRGTGKTSDSIPDDGWVQVEVEEGAELDEIFEEARKQKKNKNFI